MNDDPIKNIFEELGRSQFSSIWEIGLRILILCISLFIILKTLPLLHKKFVFFKFYQNWYNQYQGWLEFIILGIILLIVLNLLEQLPWKSTFILGGAVLVSLGLSFREVLINIIAYPIVQRIIRSKKGDYVELGAYNGQLMKRGFTHISLRGESEKQIIIPNRQILTEIFLSTEKQNTYHFTIEFPVLDIYKNELSKLLELCHETVLLSAYRSFQHPPEVGAILKNGDLWLTCKCYTNREKNVSPFRTHLLIELAEKTNILSTSNKQAPPLLRETVHTQLLSQDQRPHQLKYGDIEKKATTPNALDRLHDEVVPTGNGPEGEAIDKTEEVNASSTEGRPDEKENQGDLHKDGPPQYTISEIENLEDMDLLYEFAMSTNPDHASAAMVAIERMQKKTTNPEKQDPLLKEKSMGRPSAEEAIPEKQYSDEEPSAEAHKTTTNHADELDQLYEQALSSDSVKAEAAMQAIERIQKELITKHIPDLPVPEDGKAEGRPVEDQPNDHDQIPSSKEVEVEVEDVAKELIKTQQETIVEEDKGIEKTYPKDVKRNPTEDRPDKLVTKEKMEDHPDEVLLLKKPESSDSTKGFPKRSKEK